MADAPLALLVMAPALTQGMLTDAHRERLRASCRVPHAEPVASLDEPAAAAHLGDVEILLSGWGCPPLDAATLARVPRLRFVAHAAGTVKNHAPPECFERVRISSAAAANALPVAEYTLAAILLANKRVFRLRRLYAEVRSFRLWAKEAPGLGNLDKVVGVVGASRVGRRVLELLRPFDFDVLIHDPTLAPGDAEALGAELVEIDDLMARSDVVTLHAPSLESTRGLIDARRLALMRDGTVLVNTARGALVDHPALVRELESGRIDAVLDTTEPELLPADSPLYELPNVFLTPHVAGALGAETGRLVDLALDEIERFVRGEPLRHEVRARDLETIA